MTSKVTVQGSVNIEPEDGFNSPPIGPYPLNYELTGQKQPLAHTVEILPADTFGSKTFSVPAHLLTNQNLVIIKTDLPVKVRVRDTATTPITFEKTLRAGGKIELDGGDPPVDFIDFEGIATSAPCAKVTIIISGS